MRKLAYVLTFLILVVSASSAYAAYDARTVSRSWKNPDAAMRTALHFTVTDSGPNGNVSKSVWVYVTLRLAKEAPLRIGEVERFRVEGSVFKSADRSYHYVRIKAYPEVAYYKYSAMYQSVPVYTKGTGYCTFYPLHDGKLLTGAAPSVDKGKVDFTTPAEPLTFSFRDFAYEENGQAVTSYRFSVYRYRLFGKFKLVAKGEFPRVDEERQSVTIEENGPYTEGAEEWFKEGSTYLVYLRVKRLGTEWYDENFGASFNGQFDYVQDEEGKQALTVMTPEQADKAARAKDRFEKLHQK